ncbi:isoprenylcysteine carboxylmethyltransferase family protein [Balneolaceae bacterium ANBcel3]|nr:isoprenylcysteine carboxylmethyltransferase family protein [Balneolaceae bacterium ANBcel3]
MEKYSQNRLAKGAFWTSMAFYGLIAFEFFYMFSPFAVYFYAVYGPGLDILSLSGSTSWLIAFFMPHIARETSSFFISWHEAIGMILFVAGLLAFMVGAIKIYLSKLKKQGAVVRGVYRYIRHPQYLALMISSVGMVLIWPRYLVLIGCITVCFAYVLLARIEEKLCLRDFEGYDVYMSKTGMFLPKSIERFLSIISVPSSRAGKGLGIAALYLILLATFLGGARVLQTYSVHSLYTLSTPQEVYLSIGKFETNEFNELIDIIYADKEVSEILSRQKNPENRWINYVMPTDLLISEVPMEIPEGRVPSHRSPHKEDPSRYKIIFTIADFGASSPGNHLNILKRAVNKTPVLEVWIDRVQQNVEKWILPTEEEVYFGMPVPVF